VQTLWQDLRHGLRVLHKSPGFTTVAVLTLALGIGANTAIFQLLDAVRLRTLPVSNPQQIVELRLRNTIGLRGSQQSGYPVLTNAIWEQVRDRRMQAFSGVFAWAEDDFNTAPVGEIRHAAGLYVSGDFFRLLAVRPVLGRVFSAADDRHGCGLPGAVVSYGFWRRELGGDPAVVGRTITLNYNPVRVIGVAPASFTGLDVGQSFDVAVPICSQPALGAGYSFLDDGTIWWLSIMGRLKPGRTLEQATAELGSVSPGIFEATLPKQYPRENVTDYLHFTLMADSAENGISSLREQYADPLWLLLATAGLVLLMACANLANLMLARVSAREREIALRLALGASRRRLIDQLMTESLLLGMIGAGAGLLLAGALSRFLVAFLTTQDNGLFLDLRLDWRVLTFTTAVAVFTCLLFGLTPAWRATSVAPGTAMKSGGRGLTEARERFSLRRALVATQVSLSLVLLVGALLFSRSLHNLMTVNPGFSESGILVTDVDLSRVNLDIMRRPLYKLELLDRLRAIPGVDAAADVRILPLTGSGTDNAVWRSGSEASAGFDSNFNMVSRDYFKTMQVPFLAGRDFDGRDTPNSPPVAIVNQAFDRELGIGPNPVGKIFWRQATPADPEMRFEIIGLVGDTKYRNIRAGFEPIAYLATSQDLRFTNWWVQIVIRSKVPVGDLTSRVRETLRGMNPAISADFELFQTTIRNGLLRDRLMATLSGFFGFLAAVLAIVGIYGVMSYTVSRRTNEIGIRMTLGAQSGEVLTMILCEAGILVAVGLGAGLLLTLAGGAAARTLLFGLQPYDPLSLVAAAMLVAAVAFGASYLPARRATRIDPMVALKYE
jgi:predicted permease